MNKIILAVAFIFLVFTASTPVAADTNKEMKVLSEKDFTSKICDKFTRPVVEKAMEAKTQRIKEDEFLAWLERTAVKGMEMSGDIAIISPADKRSMRALVNGVYNGTWKSVANAVADCRAGADAFPDSERENLKKVRAHFGNQKKQASMR